MPISKAVQIDEKVVVYDENNVVIKKYFGKLCDYNNKAVTVYYDSPVRHFSTYNTKGERIAMELEKTEIKIEFEYKGVKIKAIATFDDKNNYGAIMESPIKGLITNDYSHIFAGYPIIFNKEEIEAKSISALKDAYDEYLEILNRKSALKFWLTLSENNKKHADESLNDLKLVASFIKESFKKKEINEAKFHKLNKIIKNEIISKAWKNDNIYSDNFKNFVLCNTKKLAIRNIVEIGKRIIAEDEQEKKIILKRLINNIKMIILKNNNI